jgi:hypothetical protein
MLKPLHDRFSHVRGLWSEGVLGKWLIALYGAANLYTFIRDEIRQPHHSDKWGVIELIPHLSISWWLAGWLCVAMLWVFESSYKSYKKLKGKITTYEAQSPLKIIFDPQNPGRRFWSLENMKDENGVQVPGSYWEYRAVIRNTSLTKTLRGVRVTVEAIGALPTRPEQSRFDIDKRNQRDLSPTEECLAVIRCWHNPVILAGMAIGPNIYGPIKMTASADDVAPTMAIFAFDPVQTPMITEVTADKSINPD